MRLGLSFVDKQGDCDILNNLLFLQASGLVWTTEDLLSDKKTPPCIPVALADHRKNSIFIFLLLLLYGVNVVVISPPLIPSVSIPDNT